MLKITKGQRFLKKLAPVCTTGFNRAPKGCGAKLSTLKKNTLCIQYRTCPNRSA